MQHLSYFLLISLGTKVAEKVHDSNVAESYSDNSVFKHGVETLFSNYWLKLVLRNAANTRAI